MKYHFTTFFDKNYLSRGLTLFNSMDEHIEDFELYVLALDNEVSTYIKKKKDSRLKLIKLEEVENKYSGLREAKNNRSTIEYYFTLSPVLPLYILENNPEIPFITSLDADIYFLNNPIQLFKKFNSYSIMITAHNFPERLRHLERFGRYNVSFQSFRNDREGLKCLRYWKDQCIAWCYDVLENEKYADQKYLDTWVIDYKNVLELSDSTAGIAPWNANKYKIEKIGKKYFSGNKELIFYHFHGLRYLNKNVVKHGLDKYGLKLRKDLFKLYQEYIFKVSKGDKILRKKDSKVLRIQENYSKKGIIKLIIDGLAVYNIRNIMIIHIKSTLIKKVFNRMNNLYK